jgi:cytochrome c553
MRDVTLRSLGRIGIVAGKFKPLASTIDRNRKHAATTDRSDPLAFGKYLVMNTCSECHGQDLEGDAFLEAPGLAVLAGYSNDAFRRLMSTGIAIGGRKLGLMTEVGVTRFPNFTEEELEAMQMYLGVTYGNLALARGAGDVKPTASQTPPAAADRS